MKKIKIENSDLNKVSEFVLRQMWALNPLIPCNSGQPFAVSDSDSECLDIIPIGIPIPVPIPHH